MTKTIAISGLTALACLMGAAGAVHAQQGATQEFSFPSREGSYSPPSTLRITEQPGAGSAAAPSGAVQDTPESLAEFRRCRSNADRAATNNTDLQARVTACLNELQARRQR